MPTDSSPSPDASAPRREEDSSPGDSGENSSPQTGAPGSDVPLQGTHQGDTDDPLTSSVRGQQPPDPTPSADRVAEDEPSGEGAAAEASGDVRTYQLSHDSASGRHRVRLRPPAEEDEAAGGGFKELSRHESEEDLSSALDEQLPDGPRFIVLENTDTGEVRVDREGAVANDWFGDGRFDQATLFDDENEASAYADEQQQGH